MAGPALLLILASAIAFGAGAWRLANGDLPSDDERLGQIDRLEVTVLPVVQDLQVEYYMNEAGCINLTYPRGDFVDGDPEHCGGSTDDPDPFDEVARADHERITAALEASGTPVERIGGKYSTDGRTLSVWFQSGKGAPFATSWSLEYDPDHETTAGPDGMVTNTPVEGKVDWWFACCAD